MASVDYPIECPHCGYEHCIRTFYTRTYEVSTSCDRCGYVHRWFIVNRKEREEAGDHWQPEFTEEETIAYCAVIYRFKDMGATALGSLYRPRLGSGRGPLAEDGCRLADGKGRVWFQDGLASGRERLSQFWVGSTG